ncbi:hypothetical protein A9P82_12230 [Arachidicoccus ginsenosidimutans]|uniref:sensor histidine kinase n=1 Tax=Arachidicoccus sp. BS20 TaxID=1850526 RepID=UPI0007F0CE2B|nr:HAMP domain-containing sensor histidine kinase [Arachidicoccus sp. BS20]ANI89985.1 hypothetical protein A9P82_12230 [Arachidicoccus sp. BS20]
MKKAIPVSLVLVALSLIGFVILQINWVFNIVQTQEQKIMYKLDLAGREIADSLGSTQSIASIRLNNRAFQMPSFNAPPDPFSNKISYRLTATEVNNIIRKILAKNDLKASNVEYCIYYGPIITGISEYLSPDFANVSQKINEDPAYAANSFNYSYPINPRTDISNGFIISNETLTILMPYISKQAWHSLTWILIGSALLTLITISAFYLTVRNMLQQRNLSKIKSDFINNMTHEFKTPLATISLAIDALHNPKVKGNAEKTEYFGGIIKEENKRMNKHVETILQAALMEKEELQLNKTELHVHDIIRGLVDNFSLQLQDKAGQAITHLNAANDLISGDEVHITNLFNNLIDNAVKYSKPDVPPRIVITTTNSAKNIVVQLKDNGIGMSKESVKRIFEKFYRAHTGNLHNVKGFGLGMTYVKDIIDAHKGKIKVESTLGKGTTFTVELPLT